MYALILTICFTPVGVDNPLDSEYICQDAYISGKHRTMEICKREMGKEIKLIKESIVNEFEWTITCAKKD